MGPLLLILVALVIIVLLDALWLGVLMKGFYATHLSPLGLQQPFRLWAGALVWLLIAVGLVLFVLPRAGGDVGKALLWGAIFGLVTYGVYDLTNYAVLAKWPMIVVGADIAWGAVLCGVASAATVFLQNRFS